MITEAMSMPLVWLQPFCSTESHSFQQRASHEDSAWAGFACILAVSLSNWSTDQDTGPLVLAAELSFQSSGFTYSGSPELNQTHSYPLIGPATFLSPTSQGL